MSDYTEDSFDDIDDMSSFQEEDLNSEEESFNS